MSAPLEAHATPARAWVRTGVLAFLLVIGVAGASLPRRVDNWDNVVKLQLARGLLRGDGFTVRHLTPDDAQYVQLGRDGRRYTGYLPVAAALHILTVQVALLTGVEAEGVPALLLLGLLAWTLVSWGRRAGVSPGAAAAGAVVACLGTALWPMAALGYDVVIEALALGLLLRAGAGDRDELGPWVLAGATIGLAFATRLGAALLAVPAVVLAFAAPPGGVRSGLRRGAALAAASAPGIAVVLWYNAHRFGAPFIVPRTTALGTVSDVLAPWFSADHLAGVAGLLLSPGKGVFWYSPPLLAVAAYAPSVWSRHRAAVLAIAAWGVTALVLFGRLRFWHGDWGWGPRYLAPLFVAAAPAAWVVAERLRGARPRVLAAALALLVAAVSVQAAPVVGRPVQCHFELVVFPLGAQGLLATSPVTRPPGPKDYGILYFSPQHSMIASLARGLAREVVNPKFWGQVLRALTVPLAAGALVAAAWRWGAPRDAEVPRPLRRERSGVAP